MKKLIANDFHRELAAIGLVHHYGNWQSLNGINIYTGQ